jgi:signal peptidase I
MPPTLTDRLAGVSPAVIVVLVMALTLIRLVLVRSRAAWAQTLSELCDTAAFVLLFSFLLIRPFVAQAFYIPSESMERTLLVGDRLIADKISLRFREPQRGDILVFAAPPEATGGADQDYIKRCIATPGQTIEVKGAKMTIDGQEIGPVSDSPSENPVRDLLREQLGIDRDTPIRIETDAVRIGAERLSPHALAQRLHRPDARLRLTPGQTLIDGHPLDEPYTNEDPGYNYGPVTVPPGTLFVMGDNRNRSADSHYWGALARWRVVGRAQSVFFPLTRAGTLP